MRISSLFRSRGTARLDVSTVLEGARSWLGNELRGEVVPARLRDTASRLATLIDPKRPESASEPVEVVSLEAALAARDSVREHGNPEAARAELPQDHGPHVSAQPAGVCPFTGMRADGTLAVPPSAVAGAKDPTLELTMPSETPEAAANEALVTVSGSAAGISTGAAEAAPPAVAAAPAQPVRKPRQKNKERLAGDEVVENTSARSATRPAKKQPRSRTQATRKKA